MKTQLRLFWLLNGRAYAVRNAKKGGTQYTVRTRGWGGGHPHLLRRKLSDIQCNNTKYI